MKTGFEEIPLDSRFHGNDKKRWVSSVCSRSLDPRSSPGLQSGMRIGFNCGQLRRFNGFQHYFSDIFSLH